MKIKVISLSLIVLIAAAIFSMNMIDVDEVGTNDPSQPNVVIFFLDDSGYGDYEHNGNPTIKTPNISALKKSGVNFTQYYVTSPACSASRYSLLTGRYPARSGLEAWVVGPEDARHIHDKELTLAEGLKSVGYRTGIFGKWHLGTPNESNGFSEKTLPLAHGFDEWVGTNVSHDYSTAMLIKSSSDGTTPIPGYEVLAKDLPSDIKASESLTEISKESTIDFIKRYKDQPFFAYVPFNMPHLGLFVGDAFKEKSRRGMLGDVMEEVDSAIGEICHALTEAGVSENTIVIFSSDNGPWVKFNNVSNSHKYEDARLKVGYATPFRDGKGSTWEGGHRVAGIVSWPSKIQGGRNVQTPVSTLDMLPTLFALTGVDIPEDRTIDGRDIRSILFSDGANYRLGEFKFFYNYDDNQPSAIRKGPWKLHVRTGSQTGNDYGFSVSRESPILFQVEYDLGERIDLASSESDKTAELYYDLLKFEKQLDSEGTYWDNPSRNP